MRLAKRPRQGFQQKLLEWFHSCKRALPWRGTRNAYRIWLSEVMLQQTRVAAVLDYYRRFLRRFPTVRALARARETDVLKHWAGLGYYSRARNLHAAAKRIVAEHDGRFPREMDAALGLPGVGRYTAAAVLSIAYQQPHAVLDGNVARVLSRLFALRGDLRQPQRWKQLQARADAMLRGFSPDGFAAGETARSPSLASSDFGINKLRAGKPRQAVALQRRTPAAFGRQGAQAKSLCYGPGDWNQALMELGATVCTPRAPRCDVCPVARWCRARALGIAERLPATRRTQPPVRIALAAAVLLDPRGRTLLVPPNGGAHDGLFSRMWQFPAVAGGCNAGSQLAASLRAMKSKRSTQRTQRGTEVAESEPKLIALEPARHAVTYRDVTLQPYLARVARLPRVCGAQTPRLDQLEVLPVSNATRKVAQRALEFLAQQNRALLPAGPRGKDANM